MDFSDLGFDDSMGESLGSGLDNSALDLSGTDAMSLDFLGETPLQGSSVALGFDDGLASNAGVSDLASFDSFFHDSSLSGVSDPAPSWDDSYGGNYNGAGTASNYLPSPPDDLQWLSNLLNGADKFGSSLGPMFAGHSSGPGAVVGSPIPNANPNRLNVTSISGSHTLLLVGIAVVLVGAIVFSRRAGGGS